MLVQITKTFRSRTGQGFVAGTKINVSEDFYKRFKDSLIVIPMLEDLTVKELIDYAYCKQIDVSGLKKKQEIIDKIKGV